MTEVSDALSAANSSRIREVFDYFDADKSDTISKKEIPSAVRFLGCFPSERVLVNDIIESMQGDEPNEGFVTYNDFHREMLKLLNGKSYEPATADLLLQAFRMIDTNNSGYIDGDVMERLLLTKGEAFRQQELDDFMAVSRDPETGKIFYEDFVTLATKGRV